MAGAALPACPAALCGNASSAGWCQLAMAGWVLNRDRVLLPATVLGHHVSTHVKGRPGD